MGHLETQIQNQVTERNVKVLIFDYLQRIL